MTIFNSLGSNYNFDFVLKALFAENNYKRKLEELLKKKYQGDIYLLYKGREALRLALKACNLQGSTVAICGFTCYAVYDAVIKEGYTVEYLDIEKSSLHFSYETLKKQLQKNSEIKIVVIQNTLGYPCDIEKIAALCKEKNIILIEDLAHAIGTMYENGKEAGSVGDFVILSFSQDKVVDGISGGALIVKNAKFKMQSLENNFLEIPISKQTVDRLYPFFTYKIRKAYAVGVGKAYHAFLKTLHLLSNPMTESKTLHALPGWYCFLIYREFINLEKNLQHRKKIAEIYKKNLNKELLYESICSQISLSTNLRFPIFVEKRQSLINYLKNHNIFVSDIWYDSPIAPKKYLHTTNYTNQCPESEKTSAVILNLPTHRNVSEKDASAIVALINQWQTLQ